MGRRSPGAGPAHPLARPADETCLVRFAYETGGQKGGEFQVECHRSWAPASYDRFMTLVDSGFFENQYIYRAIKDFVVNFNYGPTTGTMDKDAELARLYEGLEWFRPKELEKEQGGKQVKNLPGTIVFGQEDDGTTKTEIFINMVDNSGKLDKLGFWPFGIIKSPTSEPVQAILAAWQDEGGGAAMNFEHGDVFFAGGVTMEKANIRKSVLVASGNKYIERHYPGCTKIVAVGKVAA